MIMVIITIIIFVMVIVMIDNVDEPRNDDSTCV